MTRPAWSDEHMAVYAGDCREVMASMPAGSVHCVVTSPPYWGLRDYGTADWVGGDPSCDHAVVPDAGSTSQRGGRAYQQGHPHRDCRCGAARVDSQIGLEATPEEYVEAMVGVFREVRRVLRDDGTLWLNLGDSYFTRSVRRDGGNRDAIAAIAGAEMPAWRDYAGRGRARYSSGHPTLKDKDLVGIPWRVALALQADGWYLRSEVIWHKASVMPDGARDRPTRDHEQVFLLAKAERYFYDADAVAEPVAASTAADTALDSERVDRGYPGSPSGANGRLGRRDTRNLRTVWRVPHTPYRGAHTAVFPRGLVERCVKAGCPEGGTVLDPFAGSGTTLLVAQALGRQAVGIDLSAEYVQQAIVRASREFGSAARTEDVSMPAEGLWA